MTLNDKKVTCKRCLHILAGGTETERHAQLAALEARAELHAAALNFIEQLALYRIEHNEPGSAKEAYTLLAQHGYTLAPVVGTQATVLRRPDGSEVVR